MTTAAYPAARQVSKRVHAHFVQHHEELKESVPSSLATIPSEEIIEAIVDAGFWTSLRREEQFPPRISLAFISPEQASRALRFENPIALHPNALTRIAPGVERPGIHLGVWNFNGDLKVWGTTRNLPTLCFVLETVAPGLLVIKHRHSEGSAKFINVAVIEGDQVKVLNHEFPSADGCPSILGSLLGWDARGSSAIDSANVMIRLAVSMRDHRRGGSLLIVPRGSDDWRESIARPVSYSVSPPYSELADLLREGPVEGNQRRWRDALTRAVDEVAGFTAIDGATVINQDCEVLAFGAKIIRPNGSSPVEHVSIIEPIEGAEPSHMHATQLGGTRHISAAQFADVNREAVALVASQDGPFTIFTWSTCNKAVYGYRVEALLL